MAFDVCSLLNGGPASGPGQNLLEGEGESRAREGAYDCDQTLSFGFIGDREAVPHLPRLAVHTGVTVPPKDAHKRGENPGAGASSARSAPPNAVI